MPAPENSAAIVVRGLSQRFTGGRIALADINFTIQAGECVGLVGANGAGKTTLLLRLCGVLAGTTGVAMVAGLDPAITTNRRPLAAAVGVVFQHPDDQLFCPTVGDDIAFGLRNIGMEEVKISSLVSQSLASVGLGECADRTPGSLSGGQKRRAAIATVLAMKPAVWLFDEPTADLDPRARNEVKSLIQTLSGTKLIATHDLDLVLEVCPRVIVLDSGRLEADGASYQLLGNADLMDRHGLEVPWRLRAHKT